MRKEELAFSVRCSNTLQLQGSTLVAAVGLEILRIFIVSPSFSD
jgi:hypothetical protein